MGIVNDRFSHTEAQWKPSEEKQPPSYESLFPESFSKTKPALSDKTEITPTERWKATTRKELRNYIIKNIALAALAILGALLLAAGIICLATAVLVIPGGLLIPTGTMLFATAMINMALMEKYNCDYSNKIMAQEMINEIKTATFDSPILSKMDKLVQYGFILEDHARTLIEILSRYWRLKNDYDSFARTKDPCWQRSMDRLSPQIQEHIEELKKFINEKIVPNLPNPSEA